MLKKLNSSKWEFPLKSMLAYRYSCAMRVWQTYMICLKRILTMLVTCIAAEY